VHLEAEASETAINRRQAIDLQWVLLVEGLVMMTRSEMWSDCVELVLKRQGIKELQKLLTKKAV
jgi:acetate kinase